jgi:hypothetical protein
LAFIVALSRTIAHFAENICSAKSTYAKSRAEGKIKENQKGL